MMSQARQLLAELGASRVEAFFQKDRRPSVHRQRPAGADAYAVPRRTKP
jgi:hypothetical protein